MRSPFEISNIGRGRYRIKVRAGLEITNVKMAGLWDESLFFEIKRVDRREQVKERREQLQRMKELRG